MAVSDRVAAQIADLKNQIDALDQHHQAARQRLVAQLAALKNLKQAWTPTLDTLVEAADVKLDD